MKRLTLLTIIVFTMVLAGPAMVMSGPPGPPENPPPDGWNVNINNQPVEVTGDVNATVTGEVTVVNPPSNPVPVTVQPDGIMVNTSTGYRFKGYSTQTTIGRAGGLFGMNQICQNAFSSPTARLCTTRDVRQSPVIPLAAPPPYDAWIQPEYVASFGYIYEDSSGQMKHLQVNVDYSGFAWAGTPMSTFERLPNCGGWSHDGIDPEYRGLTIHTQTGGILDTACSRELPVTCCDIVELP